MPVTGYWVSLAAVGAQWLALYVQPHDPCGDGVHNNCGPATYLFYNTGTGQLRTPHLNPNQYIDLDAPTLARTICRPATLPASASSPDPGIVSRYGAFVLGPWPYIARCGSHQRISIPGSETYYATVANRQAIMFVLNSRQRVDGIWLPSLRRFTFRVPRGMVVPFAIGPRHLFLTGLRGGLWEAAIPSTPPR